MVYFTCVRSCMRNKIEIPTKLSHQLENECARPNVSPILARGVKIHGFMRSFFMEPLIIISVTYYESTV